jgi:hypothetical protein
VCRYYQLEVGGGSIVYIYCVCFNIIAVVLALNLMTAFFLDAFEMASTVDIVRRKLNKQVSFFHASMHTFIYIYIYIVHMLIIFCWHAFPLLSLTLLFSDISFFFPFFFFFFFFKFNYSNYMAICI